MSKILLENVRFDLEHIQREAGILGCLIAGLGPQMLKVVHLVRVVLGWHVHDLELLWGLGQRLIGPLRIFNPTVLDDQIPKIIEQVRLLIKK